MSQAITKFAAKRLLGKELEKYKKRGPESHYDPYYATIPHPRKPGKTKKVKKQIPDYIPEHDAIILAKMRQRAYWLDLSLFNFLGFRFGWSSVIGLVPAAGDTVDALLAFLLVLRCTKVDCGLGNKTLALMMINIMLDFLVGLVPIVGDLADAALRANSRNVRLLEKRLDQVYKPNHLKAAASKAEKEYPAAEFEDLEQSDDERLPMHQQDIEPRRPDPARVPTETRGGERTETRKGSLKKKDSRREKRRDEEMGNIKNSRSGNRS